MNAETKLNIILATNSDDPTLEMRGLHRFPDGSGFYCDLFVRSEGFSALRPFYFCEFSFKNALKALNCMNAQLNGEARFEEQWEHDQFLCFKMLSCGHVLVSGQLALLGERTNRLTFEFETDQTCLAPLVHSLGAFNR